MSIHQQQKTDEFDNIDEWMKSHDWEQDEAANHWIIDVADTLSVPLAHFGFVKSRLVTDPKTWHVVETFLSGPTTKLDQVHRKFKSSKNGHVVLEVNKKRRARSR